jgi:hypothetical protein
VQSPAETVQSPEPAAQSPDEAPPSLAEVRELALAGRARWLAAATPRRAQPIDEHDRELLAWLAAARCATTTQLHTRFQPGQALTGTQRRLKRLADCGLIARFQLYRANGGGLPQCCAATQRALDLLEIRGRAAPELGDRWLGELVDDIRVVGWLLAFERAAGAAVREILGPRRAAIAPPRELGPAALGLGDGLRARDFSETVTPGISRPVERFAAVRPDAVIEARADDGARDLLVVRQPGSEVDWLERYDHLVSGWWRVVPRYARLGAPPQVVVICDDPHQLADAAEQVVRATLARIGTAPGAWERPGREQIHFARELDAHAGSLASWRLGPGGAPERTELIRRGPTPQALPRWR